LQYIYETPDIQQDLHKFFLLLSPALKNQVLFFMHSSLISDIPSFSQCSDIEVSFMVNNL